MLVGVTSSDTSFGFSLSLSPSLVVSAEPEARGLSRANQPLLPAQRRAAGSVHDRCCFRLRQPIVGAQAPDVRVQGECGLERTAAHSEYCCTGTHAVPGTAVLLSSTVIVTAVYYHGGVFWLQLCSQYDMKTWVQHRYQSDRCFVRGGGGGVPFLI